ncbi:MAG TPA: hypothetical protein VK484_11020 [Ferruginibacter sp.]|nr:hypothetical protein [Ferruginibacter sp.]
MAKKKAAVKKAATKKPASKPGKSNTGAKSKEQTIRVIVEVVIKREDLQPGSNRSFISPLMMDAAADAANNFSYSFDLQNAKILNLIVEGFSQDNPPASGSFFTPVLDPNDPQQVRVIVVATQNNPNPFGSLSLKYKGKDLADNPIAIDFSGAMGSINNLVNLPQ